jgi:hypothetical protein
LWPNQGTILASAWRDFGKPQNIRFMIAGVLAKIWTEYLLNTSLDRSVCMNILIIIWRNELATLNSSKDYSCKSGFVEWRWWVCKYLLTLGSNRTGNPLKTSLNDTQPAVAGTFKWQQVSAVGLILFFILWCISISERHTLVKVRQNIQKSCHLLKIRQNIVKIKAWAPIKHCGIAE